MKEPADQQPVEVDDLDGRALRDAVSEHSVESLRSACRRYVLAYRWCITHPPADAADRAVMGDARLPGLQDDDTCVGGEGTPGVAARTVSEYAALAGVSTGAAIRTLSDALDLHHRLPGLWRRVKALRVPAWTAAHIAQDTARFSAEAASWVDARLTTLDRYDRSTIDATVKQAMATFHPELLRNDVLPGREEWDVSVDHGACADGTSRLEAIGDSLDLVKFHDLVADEAAQLRALGDTDTLGQRKAKALGVIADRQATLDLDGLAPLEETTNDTTAPGARGDSAAEPDATPPRRSYARTRLYLHLTLADLAASWDGDPARVGDAGRLGPHLLHQIEQWLTACGSDAKITPVIDLNREWAVDRHDPPEAMREAVIQRDQRCVFPSCTVDARHCDLDHIEPYDPDGPPGQTSPARLAALCRRHHRLKTLTAWTYHRDLDHPLAYVWTSPHGERWHVVPGRATTRLPDRGDGWSTDRS